MSPQQCHQVPLGEQTLDAPLPPPRLPCAPPRKAALLRLSSLDSILEYKEAMAQERHTLPDRNNVGTLQGAGKQGSTAFTCRIAEVGFCLSMAISQLVGEYLISGFSILLPTLMTRFRTSDQDVSNLWPASMLPLLLCSTILAFSRFSDMYGGYPTFMLAMVWLIIWSIVAGFSTSLVVLNISRAMQGLAIAGFTPSTFTLLGTLYPPGPRRNLVLGIYGACAPIGFFLGNIVAASLPSHLFGWYFHIAAILAAVALITAFTCVPVDVYNKPSVSLTMDWPGAFTITTGLILVAYSLAASSRSAAAWATPAVLVPFIIGLLCLSLAVYIEARVALCPLVPLEFFKPKSVKPFVIACLFFYGSFGTWLFTSSTYLRSAYDISLATLGIWYTPLAIGGIILALVSSAILHRVSPTLILLISSFAWVAAPLLLALGSTAAGYWAFPFPSMLCATLGVDLTYTISTVFLSSVQPRKWQGLSGAMSSVLVNMGIAFSLAVAQIVEDASLRVTGTGKEQLQTANQHALFFAAASAGVGVVVVALFVRISSAVVDEVPEAQARTSDDDAWEMRDVGTLVVAVPRAGKF